MGGGPSSQAKTAMAAQANQANTAADAEKQAMEQQQQARNLAMPFYTSRMQSGLPFFNSLTDYTSGQSAQAFAPARAQILRDTARYGSNLPSGYRDSLLNNLEAQRGQMFDQSLTNNLMLNEQAKQAGAQGIMGQQQLSNPLGWSSAAQQANTSLINAPRGPGVAGILGGIAQSGLNALGMAKMGGCWMAAAVFGEDFATGWKTALVREYLWNIWGRNFYAKPVLWFYQKFGKWAATKPVLVRLCRPLFELALRKAIEHAV